jgi:hypothetical protein
MNYEELKEHFELCRDLAIRCLNFRKQKVAYSYQQNTRMDDGNELEFVWTDKDKIYIRTYIDGYGSEHVFHLSKDTGISLFCNTGCSVAYNKDDEFFGYSFVNSENSDLLDTDDYVDTFFKEGLCTEDEHFQLSLIHPELPEYNIIKRAYEEILTAPCPELEGYHLYIPFSFKTQYVRKIRRTLIHKVGI